MGTVTIYQDDPKPGETDAGWCGFVSYDGHVIYSKCGFRSEAAARTYFDAWPYHEAHSLFLEREGRSPNGWEALRMAQDLRKGATPEEAVLAEVSQ